MKIEQPKRIKHSYVQSLSAAPDRVFSLFCPTLEKEWVPDWDPIKIISTSGVAEKECMFITPAKPHDSIWIVTQHNAQTLTLEMYKITPGHTIGKLEVSLSGDGESATKANIAYEFTALGEAGEKFLDEFTSEWYDNFMKGWERALNHYLNTGEKIAL